MKNPRHRVANVIVFPLEIISRAVGLSHRLYLGFREVEEMLAEQGIIVMYETIHQWCETFGPVYARISNFACNNV